ncbi:hypothetical protein LC605_01015 [Nostoc sp. CHAB 5836]|uniref:hypothetical protein n=1 Tax=Nostoc sp. CHAB 5836 TaxID=2780404 RepID=UPI001E52D23C|nr:hypothetical protein [Nostoc sp. CHAB 5836]MCC5613681.1 hypothetical protein [Nostoc sp. CHAB 5836]
MGIILLGNWALGIGQGALGMEKRQRCKGAEGKNLFQLLSPSPSSPSSPSSPHSPLPTPHSPTPTPHNA